MGACYSNFFLKKISLAAPQSAGKDIKNSGPCFQGNWDSSTPRRKDKKRGEGIGEDLHLTICFTGCSGWECVCCTTVKYVRMHESEWPGFV